MGYVQKALQRNTYTCVRGTNYLQSYFFGDEPAIDTLYS